MATFNSIKEVKEYLKNFTNGIRYTINVDGNIPADDDIIEITSKERQYYAYDLETITIVYEDILSKKNSTTIKIKKNAGCML